MVITKYENGDVVVSENNYGTPARRNGPYRVNMNGSFRYSRNNSSGLSRAIHEDGSVFIAAGTSSIYCNYLNRREW